MTTQSRTAGTSTSPGGDPGAHGGAHGQEAGTRIRASLADWTLDPEVRHLNHGSFGAAPRSVLAVQGKLREEMDGNPDAWFRALPGRVAEARAEVAAFLRVPADELAFVLNASSGVSAVLNSQVLERGSRILLTDHSYGAVTMGVRRVAARAGALVDIVRVPLDASAERIRALFAEELARPGAPVALVVVDQITSPTARLFPVAAIVEEAHAVGARVLVDGAHAPATLAEPLAQAGAADYWTGNLHKWALAPRGTAALVARGPLAQELIPATDSWGAPNPFPERFDQQGTQDCTQWLAAPAGAAFLAERGGWDVARTELAERVGAAQAQLAEALGQDLAGVSVNEAPTMRLIPLAAGLATDPEAAAALQRRIARELRCEVSVTSWDGRGFLRLSAHVYNRPEDYAYLAERLPALLARAAD